tara:strand:- start:1560 stop:1823 length:264 start_codon:yes stop_codon:yes gene_type:complete
MTKKEKHSAINNEFIDKYENDFDIDDEMGGRLVLVPFDTCFTYSSIDYHMSRHTVDAYNWSSSETKELVIEMEEFIDTLRIKYDLPE